MTSTAPEGTRILGTLGSAEGKGVVRMEDRFERRIEDVWSALTDPAELGHWWGVVEGELQEGGEYRARLFASGWDIGIRIRRETSPMRPSLHSLQAQAVSATGLGQPCFLDIGRRHRHDAPGIAQRLDDRLLRAAECEAHEWGSGGKKPDRPATGRRNHERHGGWSARHRRHDDRPPQH